MEKVKITICCGTYCHIMGGAELQQFKDVVSPELMKGIDFRYSTCLGYCKEGKGNPPFAEINGRCIPDATIEKLIREFENQQKEEENDV